MHLAFFLSVFVSAVVSLQLRTRSGISLRDDNATVPTYSCPSNVSTPFRNDTQLEFFSLKRQPNDPSWPIIAAEVPQTYQEFMCALTNRACTAPSNCVMLLKWADPGMRTFTFTNVSFATDIYLLDKFKTVISINTREAEDPSSITSTADMNYALFSPQGRFASLEINVSDPVRIPPLSPLTFEGGPIMAPAGLPGMHN
jgi:hypothetical protein